MRPGFSISAMTLGTVQLGLDYGIANKKGKPDEEVAFRILETALDNGINCIDTAAAYGDSEKVIGKYFRQAKKRRTEVTIVTKIKLGQTATSNTGRFMMKSAEQSLKNLDTGYLDILLLHDASEFKNHEKEITDTFKKLIAQGIIKGAGASCYGLSEIEPMLQNELYSAFQMPVNLLDTAVHNRHEEDRIKNRIVFARSIFLQGLFFLDPQCLKGNLRDAAPFISTMREIAAELNISLQELAIGYVKSLGFVDSLVIGADNPEQVACNVKLLKTEPFSPAVMHLIRDRLSGAPGWLLKPYLWDKQ
jgi:aryl-alcohol dehydrogenase-like predicted oxidoreductase